MSVCCGGASAWRRGSTAEHGCRPRWVRARSADLQSLAEQLRPSARTGHWSHVDAALSSVRGSAQPTASSWITVGVAAMAYVYSHAAIRCVCGALLCAAQIGVDATRWAHGNSHRCTRRSRCTRPVCVAGLRSGAVLLLLAAGVIMAHGFALGRHTRARARGQAWRWARRRARRLQLSLRSVAPNPSIERTSPASFACFGPPLMSNVRQHKAVRRTATVITALAAGVLLGGWLSPVHFRGRSWPCPVAVTLATGPVTLPVCSHRPAFKEEARSSLRVNPMSASPSSTQCRRVASTSCYFRSGMRRTCSSSNLRMVHLCSAASP